MYNHKFLVNSVPGRFEWFFSTALARKVKPKRDNSSSEIFK